MQWKWIETRYLRGLGGRLGIGGEGGGTGGGAPGGGGGGLLYISNEYPKCSW